MAAGSVLWDTTLTKLPEFNEILWKIARRKAAKVTRRRRRRRSLSPQPLAVMFQFFIEKAQKC